MSGAFSSDMTRKEKLAVLASGVIPEINSQGQIVGIRASEEPEFVPSPEGLGPAEELRSHLMGERFRWGSSVHGVELLGVTFELHCPECWSDTRAIRLFVEREFRVRLVAQDRLGHALGERLRLEAATQLPVLDFWKQLWQVKSRVPTVFGESPPRHNTRCYCLRDAVRYAPRRSNFRCAQPGCERKAILIADGVTAPKPIREFCSLYRRGQCFCSLDCAEVEQLRLLRIEREERRCLKTGRELLNRARRLCRPSTQRWN